MLNNIDTLQLAGHEAKAWLLAQALPEPNLDQDSNKNKDGEANGQEASGRWRCQFDASWTEQDTGAGLGFILFDGDIVAMRGQRKHINPSTPLHAEAESLIWAMEELRGRGFQ